MQVYTRAPSKTSPLLYLSQPHHGSPAASAVRHRSLLPEVFAFLNQTLAPLTSKICCRAVPAAWPGASPNQMPRS